MSLNDFLGDGLPSDFDGTITSATFAEFINTKTGQPGPLSIEFGLSYVEDDEAKETNVRYTVGAGWSHVAGEQITHEAGHKRINRATQYGRFLARVAGLLADEPEEVQDGIDPTIASTWVGLTFHFVRETEHMDAFTGRDGKEVPARDITRLMPTAYVAAAEANAEEMVTLEGAGHTVQVGQSLAGQIVGLAKEHDFGKWMPAVLGLDGAATNKPLMGAVVVPAFYEAIKANA